MEKMSSSSPTVNENLLIEEREEVMVSHEGHCLRKTHFLNPSVTSIDDGSVAEIPRGDQRLSVSLSELKSLSSRVTFSGFWFADRRFIHWLEKMEALHASTWRKAGIYEAIKASTYDIDKNPSLIFSIAKKWCPETKCFIFPWGEATITLEDVMVLLGFSVLGSSVFAPLGSSEMRDSLEKLKKARLENVGTSRLKLKLWISTFLGRGDQMEHEAFLALWLSYYVFPDKFYRSMSVKILPIAVRLARGEKIALAIPVLASLYKELGEISRYESTKLIGLQSLFKLVQVWTWERFKNLRPEAKQIPNYGEPRISRWDSVQQRTENVTLSFDDFEWRPYTKPLQNWSPLRLYVEDAMWVTVDDDLEDEFVSFARCVRSSKLVGFGFVEDYYPNRVAMQFGLDQDLPGLVTYPRNFTKEDAWNDYNVCLDGLKLYLPSRIAKTYVTARHRDWWLKPVSEFRGSSESNETFNLSNTFDGDDNVHPKVIPLSQVLQKLGEGFPAKLRRCRSRRTAKSLRWEIKKDKSQILQKLGEGFPAKLRRCRTRRTAKSLRWEIEKDKSQLLQKLGDWIPAKLRRCRTAKNMRREISDDDSDESDSTELPLSPLLRKQLVKRTSERIRNKRRKLSREDDKNRIAIAHRNESREELGGDTSQKIGNRSKLEEDNNGSRNFQRFTFGDDEIVAPLEIEEMSEEDDEEESGSEANMILISSDEDSSSDYSFGPYQRAADIVVSPTETRQACDESIQKKLAVDELARNADNNKGPRQNLASGGAKGNETKKAEWLVHEDGEKKKLNEWLYRRGKKAEEIDERLKQIQLARKESDLKLDGRIVKVEKILAKIRNWKTKRSQTKIGVSS